jgi:C-terminal processing protease CtpA/Prc
MCPSLDLRNFPPLALDIGECQQLPAIWCRRLPPSSPPRRRIGAAAAIFATGRLDRAGALASYRVMPQRFPPSARRRPAATVHASLVAALLLAGCGGGGSGPIGSPSPSPSPTPTPPVGQCSLLERQRWAEQQIREWYLFPEDLPASLDPAQFSTVQAFIDALTATARAQNKDRFFTFITSIAEENAFINQGQTAAFGIRLRYDEAARRVFVIDAFETGPGFAAGLDRSAEILAIGPSASSLTSVTTLMTQGGSAAVSDALGPSEAGVTRAIQYRINGQVQTATITKAVFNIPPVSPRFGVLTLPDGDGGQIGYVNLRSFISTAETPLRQAFASFRAAGIGRVVIDYRYNSGGLVRVAELTGDLLGRNRLASDVFSFTTYRPSKSIENETRQFRTVPESIAPAGLAFITTDVSASASELVINSMLPYLGQNLTMVGANTSGKPVGQIAIDRTACDDRLRIVAFATQNRDRQGDYFNGLAPILAARGGRTCEAADDDTRQMGSSAEASTQRAIRALKGEICVPIDGASNQSFQADATPESALLTSRAPSAAQREMPGLF